MRKSKEELIQVWLDTEKTMNDPMIIPCQISTFKSKSKLHTFKHTCKIWVENQDCVEVARKLAAENKTCMLNMASYKHPGGGVKKGSMAQEEELARRSNLMLGLDGADYPLEMDDFIYCEDVTFFKDGNYNMIEPFLCDVVTIASVNLNGLERPGNYLEIMLGKVSTMFNSAYISGCRNIVLSAFGCGVFKNDPEEVASIFNTIISSGDVKDKYGVKDKFDNIVFAIINDHNADNNNYAIFKKIIEG